MPGVYQVQKPAGTSLADVASTAKSIYDIYKGASKPGDKPTPEAAKPDQVPMQSAENASAGPKLDYSSPSGSGYNSYPGAGSGAGSTSTMSLSSPQPLLLSSPGASGAIQRRMNRPSY